MNFSVELVLELSLCALYISVFCMLGVLINKSWLLGIRLLLGLNLFFVPEETQEGGPVKGLKLRSKKKEKEDWDDGGATISRMSLVPVQITQRFFFDEFDRAIMTSSQALAIWIAREMAHFLAPESMTSALVIIDSMAFMLLTCSGYKFLVLLGSIQWDAKTTWKIDWYLSVGAGAICAIIIGIVLIGVPELLDFNFDKAAENAGDVFSAFFKPQNGSIDSNIDGVPSVNMTGGANREHQPVLVPAALVKVLLSVCAGIMGGFLLPPAIRLTRCYHLATSPSRWDQGLVTQGRATRFMLHQSILLPILVLFLWIKPMIQLAILQVGGDSSDLCKSSLTVGIKEQGLAGPTLQRAVKEIDWAHCLGWTPTSFNKLRTILLILYGILQMALVRINAQAFLNSAIVSWYGHLHGSRDADLKILPSKMHLTNLFICRVALQSLMPGIIVLFFLSIASALGTQIDAIAMDGFYLAPPLLVREAFTFLAWCSTAIWAIQVTAVLCLCRVGKLRVP